MRLKAIYLVVASLLLIVAACGGDKAEKEPNPSTSQGEPTIKIVSPVTGETVSGETINIELEITNFIQDGGAIGNAMVPGTGHWHLHLDESFKTLDVGKVAVLKDVSPGIHTVKVFLVNNDHTSITPRVEDNLIINVK